MFFRIRVFYNCRNNFAIYSYLNVVKIDNQNEGTDFSCTFLLCARIICAAVCCGETNGRRFSNLRNQDI